MAGAVLLATALVAPTCFEAISDSDAGWHLALGRLIARSGLPHTNALTWTFPDHPWYDTSWLWDLAAYALTQRLGLLALQLITLATATLVFALVAMACVRRGGLAGLLVLPPTALLLIPRLAPRPHVANWLPLMAVLCLCLWAEGGSWTRRAWAILAIALGSNLHSGAIFSAAVLGAYCLQEFVRTRRGVELAVAAGGVLALCANPGLAFDLRSMLFHLSVQKTVVIAEYLPPTFVSQAPFFVLLLLVPLLAAREARQHPAALALAIAFGVLGLHAMRMIYEFYLLATPVTASALAAAWAKRPKRAVAAMACVTLLCGLAPIPWSRTFSRRHAPDWDPAVLPVRAADFALAHRLGGRYFNAYDHGGYLEWRMPEPAFVDGRVQCFPPEFFHQFYRAGHWPKPGERLFDPRQKFPGFLKGLGARWAVTARPTPWLSGGGLLDQSPDWALVYWDELSEVLVRRDIPELRSVAAAFEYRYVRPDRMADPRQVPAAELPAFAAELHRYLSTAPSDTTAWATACGVARRQQSPDAAAACTTAAHRLERVRP